jgi:hypothetical protein
MIRAADRDHGRVHRGHAEPGRCRAAVAGCHDDDDAFAPGGFDRI